MIRLATIGTSWITEAFLEGCAQTGQFCFAACYSRDPDRARSFAQRQSAAWDQLPVWAFSNLEEMAACPQIDAVYIASPNRLHFSQSRLFLQAGKHVLCEKPCTVTPQELEELQQLAQRQGLVYLEAIIPMHLPQLRVLEEALGQIGPVRLARLDFSQYSSKYPAYLRGETPNIFNPAMATGALMDLGIYCLYPALYLFGMPEGLQAQATFLRTGADGGGSVLLRYPEMLATLTYTKNAQGRGGCEILGEEGSITFQLPSRLTGLTLHHRGEQPRPLWEDDESHGQQMSHEAASFAHFIAHPHHPRYHSLSRLALQVSQVMQEIRRQTGIHFPPES